jgi:glycosyltransferase involved in cell wall biosynthesis
MKISIITTTLNSEKYLQDTLESIHSQYNENVQYILVDGGSVDNTLQIAKKYDFVELHHLPGSTMYEAIDFGFQQAEGDILSWINSDDVYMDGTLQTVRKEFKNNRIDILSGNLIYIDSTGSELYPYYFWLTNKLFIDVFKDLILCQPATFFTKELYQKIGGLNLEYEIVSDRDFFIRAFREANVKWISKILVKFRVHGENLSITKRERAIRENNKINLQLNAGPNSSFKNRALNLLGHLTIKVLNPKMVWYKIRNRTWDLYSGDQTK